MFVLFFILQQTCHIGGITQNIIDGIVIIAILIINRLGRMLFDGILIYTGRTEGLCPTIDSNVLADAQAIVKIMIVRTDAGIDTLEIRILYQTVMVEIVQR